MSLWHLSLHVLPSLPHPLLHVMETLLQMLYPE